MKLLKNFSYNLSYQLLVIILPIITTPYVTRVFTSSELGRYGYFNSIVTYFLLFATLGINTYATKEISSHHKERSTIFWEIYSIQWIASVTSLVLYIVTCITIPGMNNPISYILALSLISKALDISWLFQGVEDFKKITIRNMTVRLVGVISIFLFVKKSSDLYLYIFLLVFYELLGQLSMWIPAREWIHKPNITFLGIKKHFVPITTLFLPQIAISLYATMDRTLLGAFASNRDVGIYEQALKLITILLTLVTSLGSVMLPRVSQLLAERKHDVVSRLYELSFLLYHLIIFPTIFGILFIKEDFVQFFLGYEFQDAKYAIMIMIWRMFFIGWTNIMGIQIMIPNNMNRQFMISTTFPAFVSIICNLILVPYFGYIGAAIVSVLTEAIVWGIQLYYTRTYLRKVPILGSMFKIILAAVMMYGFLYLLKPVLTFAPALNVIVSAIIGGIIYLIIILSFRVIDLKEFRQHFVKK